MADGGESMSDIKFYTKLFELLIGELSIIVGNNSVWQSESGYNGVLNKIFHLAFSDLR